MNNNKEIIKLSWSELYDSTPVIIPDIQRIIDNDKIKSIVTYQKDYYIKYGIFNFFGVITICKYDDKNYLIDGQHRYCAMKKLYEEYNKKNESCNIEIIHVSTLDEVNEYYTIINKNTPLPSCTFTKEEKSLMNEVCKHFQIKYPNIWSKNMRCRRPNIFFNSFQESVNFICKNINIQEPREIILILENKNKSYAHFDKSHFKNVTDAMMNKAHEHKFYLGLFAFDLNEEYGYMWAKHIVEYYTNTKISKKNTKKNKTKISKPFRFTLWNTHIGKSIGEVKCIVCMQNSINMMNFECGHINPESKGGELSVENMLPICTLCNRSMGSTHMAKYVESQFPQNLHNFYKKKYITCQESNSKGLLSKLFH